MIVAVPMILYDLYDCCSADDFSMIFMIVAVPMIFL